jgi:hypothetical protein
MPEITITPPLSVQEFSHIDFRTVELIPADGPDGGADRLAARTGTNYRPEWMRQHLQDIVDTFAAHEFTGYIEVRNTSPSHPPVSRYHVQDRKVVREDAEIRWPADGPVVVPEYLSAAALADLLLDAAARVHRRDSFDGTIAWNLSDRDDDEFDVRGLYRTGNSRGQGGVRLIQGRTEPV